jgi:prepilin-type N-terminal cleavage/methylation domain-containing protein
VRRKADERGFTLVEMMAAVAILALIIVPLTRAYLASSATTGKSHELSGANLAAQNIIENIKAVGADKWKSDNADKLSGALGFEFNGYQSAGLFYDLEVILDPAPYAAINADAITDYTRMDGIGAQPKDVNENPDMLVEDYIALEKLSTLDSYTGTPMGGLYDHQVAVPVNEDGKTYTRTITLLAFKSGDRIYISARYVYEYRFEFEVEYYIGDDVASTSNTQTKVIRTADDQYEHVFYEEADTGDPLSIYYCYLPRYENNGRPDTILIRNGIGAYAGVSGLTFFIAKQKHELEDPLLEFGYNALINRYYTTGLGTQGQAKVYTNFNVTQDGSDTIPSCELRYYTSSGDTGTYDSSRNPRPANATRPWPTLTGELVSRTAKDRLLAVTVIVSRNGRQIVTVTGSQLD